MTTEPDRLRELLAISRAITSTTSYEETLHLVVEKACAFTKADACLLLLAEPGVPATVAASCGAVPSSVRELPIVLDERLAVPLREAFELGSEGEIMAVPMIIGGNVRGSLVVVRRRGRAPEEQRSGAEERLRLLSALADQASIALGHMAHVRELDAAVGRAELLRALADAIPSMMAYWDADLRCRFANRAYREWFGVAPEWLLGRHIRELLGPLYEQNLPYMERALRGEPQEFEREIPDPAGGPPRHSLAHYVPHIVDGVVRGFFVVVHDVSAIKRVEHALRESEERFRLTLDEAPIGMALVEPGGRFVRVNHALCEIVGYPADELTGLTFQAITHPDDLDADLALVDRLTRGEIHRYELEKRYIRKDGAVVDVQLTGSVLRGPEGAPLYFIAQVQDITERKRAQDALRQSQERFELALEGADLASWDWNISTGEVVFNRRWAEMRGFRPEEMAPHVDAWISGVHPEDWPRVQKTLADYFEGRIPEYQTEHRVLTKSGQYIWVLDRGKVFARDGAGRPLRMSGTELDITERKRIEREQRFLAEVGPVLATTLDYEETLAKIADLAVQDIADICIVDVGTSDEEIRRVKVACRDPSKAWLCDVLARVRREGYAPYLLRSVMVARGPVLLQNPSDELIRSVAQSEEHLRALQAAEIRSMVAVPLLAHTKLVGAIAFISSTPSRIYGDADVRLAQELAQRAALSIENARLYQAARQATQARDDVLAIVAHDLRSPLSGIVMQARLLMRTAEQRSKDAAGMIERAAWRMNRLIQDLLDVTRLDAGRLSVEKTRVPTAQIVSDSVDAQRSVADAASLTLRLELAPDLPEVWGDRDRLLQILENLIGNALKFTPPGGRVTVGARPGDGEVLFWVSDTGRGIAEGDMPHLFDRFWQARKADRRGAGLGLPIAKGLVEAQGGHIRVESTPGRGTTFHFTIPTAGRAAASSHAAPRHAP